MTRRRSRLPAASRIAAALTVATVAAAGAFASPAAAKAPAPPPPTFFGISPQTELTSADYARMSQSNFGTLRVAIPWRVVDPVAPVGGFDWSSSDRIIAAAASHGIEVQPVLYATPEWVAKDLDGFACDVSNCFLHGPRSANAQIAWSIFVAAAVDRYGVGGKFWSICGCPGSTPIKVWQIWNEQNSGSFYLPAPNPQDYAKTVKYAALAIRGQDPSARVILGGMAELDGVANVMPAHNFLRKLYKIEGFKAEFDGVASHPYGNNLKGVTKQVDLLRKEMIAARDKRTAMYVTEIGWSSENGGNWLNLGTSGQVAMIRKAYKYFTTQRRALRLQNVTYFTWSDSTSATVCEWCGQAGLLNAALQPKPAFAALTKFTGAG